MTWWRLFCIKIITYICSSKQFIWFMLSESWSLRFSMLYKKITSINFYILTEPLKLSREKWFKIYFYEFVVQKKFNTDTISDARDPIFRWFCCPCSLLLIEFSNFDICDLYQSTSHLVSHKNYFISLLVTSIYLIFREGAFILMKVPFQKIVKIDVHIDVKIGEL